ncbi:hypothetical protein PtA15_18A359 [Puccinia triticina]|uniref:Uncharacterized protein n=1 Tax=Puccinia triticina TaxID=208348 RepID=A0ABY7D6L1_9BASI|nr:uncharacterized protein PtA15_18A359 [Puccinia triticina]WAQ93299.1 hypothetical protein PtA15_18A359 [Puccinia triticina]WAR63289.1 hypothetical protein PtB15_18B372 [Puccinia triticina]
MSNGPLARLAFRRICHSVSNVGQSVMPPKHKEPDRSPPPDRNSRNSKLPKVVEIDDEEERIINVSNSDGEATTSSQIDMFKV